MAFIEKSFPFHEKYISTKVNTGEPDETKIVLSDDAYAICEMLNVLISKLNKLK
jgi:hypothetical protein